MAGPRQTSDRKHRSSSRLIVLSEPLEARQLLNGALTGSFAGAIPGALLPAATNHVNVRLTNTSGGAEAGAVKVSLYVSPTPDVGTDAVVVGTASRAVRMRAGQSLSFPFRFASPASLPNGTDYLVAKVDGPASADGSPNESIVVAPRAVAVMQPVVELAGQVEAPMAPLYATQFGASRSRAQILITNTGNIPARGPMHITLYSSTNGALDGSATVVGVATFRGAVIRPGAYRPFPVGIRTPAGTAVGSYTLFASINSAQAGNAIVATGGRPLVVTNPPIVIDRRGPHGSGDGSGFAGGIGFAVGVDSGAAFYAGGFDTGSTDTSGTDTSPPPPDTSGTDTTTAPTTAPTDSGGSTDNNGSDFGGGDSSSGDSGGGTDF